MPSLDALHLDGQRVLLRLDLNTPLHDGEVADDTRIRAVLPTIRLLKERGAKIVACSHLGRPKGKRVPALTLEPVGARLAELLDDEVLFSHQTIGDDVEFISQDLPRGGLLLLENLRFEPGEKANDMEFAQQLARLGDVYVNDAFGALHRAHASVSAINSCFAERAAGPLVAKELEVLGRLLGDVPRPYVGVLGGAKVSDKIKVIEALVHRVDTLIIGGAMAYTFLAARGESIGDSLVETDRIRLAHRLLQRCQDKGVEVLLPVDHVAATGPDDEAPQVVEAIPAGLMGFDIGPQSTERFSNCLREAGTIFWNGPLGMFEVDRFAAGTNAVAAAVADSRAFSVVGGGDSAAAVQKAGLADRIDHISTGGGASLEFIQGVELPGLRALRTGKP
ncbi:MAG: phosphoglycerate kinase [Alphaproteobacteria bacterium]|nr:phosphoglycerate kinase [Alphaproteobacteria bacterium]